MDSQYLNQIASHISIHRMPVMLARIAIVLILLSSIGQLVKLQTGHDSIYGFIPLFNLDAERNIPTFFSALILCFASIVLSLIYSLSKRDGQTPYWLVLCLGFALMAMDESVSFHERFILPTRLFLGANQASGLFYFAWVVPALLLVAVVGGCFIGFLSRLSPATRTAFITSAAIYLGGAVGMEMLGGWYFEKYGALTLCYSICFTLEEGMEMLGVIYFINALLRYLAVEIKEINISF